MKEHKKMKICIILGTRPEIIKLSPVIDECRKRQIEFFVIHTNQHYSAELDSIFFKELKLEDPKYNLNIGSCSHSEMIGNMMILMEKILVKEKPSIVLVQGDTNSVLAGALCASKLQIPIGHIEAGLRSYDRKMPEETNRIIVDHISDFLFVPTNEAKNILEKENIDKEKIFDVGNTVVDAVFANLDIAKKKSEILERFNLQEKEYSILTIHRPSNTDDKKTLKMIFDGLSKTESLGIKKVIFLAHPRVSKKIEKEKIKIPQNIEKYGPIGYFDMLLLMSKAKIIFTDSGGIQEEACILNIPSITLRENTERPETIKVGSSLLVGSDTQKIFNATEKMLNNKKTWSNPFGDGKSAKKIIDIVERG